MTEAQLRKDFESGVVCADVVTAAPHARATAESAGRMA